MFGVTHDIGTICDVCNEPINKFTGVRIRFDGINGTDLKKVEATFGKVNFEICLRCFILSLGVKPKNSIIALEKRNEAAFSEWKEFAAKWLKE